VTIRLAFAAALILTGMPIALHGQMERINALSVRSGTRARMLGVAPDSQFTVVTVESAGPDSLRYSISGSSDRRSLAWRQITKMDVSAGRHRHVGRGLAIGLVVGPVLGIWQGAAGQHGEERTLNELGGFFGGAFLGAVIGGTTGFLWRSEKWNPVVIPQG
jgi:hypothetical protein